MKRLLIVALVALLFPLLMCGQTVEHVVDLKWEPPADAPATGLTYVVLRSQASGGPYTRINIDPVTTPAFSDAIVVNGLVYYYVVRAVANELESQNSNEATAAIPPSPPIIIAPGSPQNLKATVRVK